MKAVDRGLSFTSRGCHGRFQPDPFDHPQDINIDQAVANFLASFIHDLIPSGDLRADIGIRLPLPSLQKNRLQRFRNRNQHFFPGFELFDPDTLLFQINVSPLHQRTVFQTLTGIHPDVIDDFDFRLIHQLAVGIVQFPADGLLLFPRKGDAAYQGSLFLAFLSQQYR